MTSAVTWSESQTTYDSVNDPIISLPVFNLGHKHVFSLCSNFWLCCTFGKQHVDVMQSCVRIPDTAVLRVADLSAVQRLLLISMSGTLNL